MKKRARQTATLAKITILLTSKQREGKQIRKRTKIFQILYLAKKNDSDFSVRLAERLSRT